MEIKDIDPNSEKVVKGQILITNLANTWSQSGCLIVNAFNHDGKYHSTYMTSMSASERGSMSETNAIVRCLKEGVKVSEVQRFIQEYPRPGVEGWD